MFIHDPPLRHGLDWHSFVSDKIFKTFQNELKLINDPQPRKRFGMYFENKGNPAVEDSCFRRTFHTWNGDFLSDLHDPYIQGRRIHWCGGGVSLLPIGPGWSAEDTLLNPVTTPPPK